MFDGAKHRGGAEIRSVTSLPLFVGDRASPVQIVRVVLRVDRWTPRDLTIEMRGTELCAPVAASVELALAGSTAIVDVPVAFGAPFGMMATVAVEVLAGGDILSAIETSLEVHRPGRTIHLVPHFHVDPVWWNTQAASISELHGSDWSGSPRMRFQASAIDVLLRHLDLADRDPDYRCSIAEIDYIVPLWDHHPEQRARLRRLIDAGRIEVVGGTYNEPSTNLSGAEATRRNLEMGLEVQRGLLGAGPSTAWQLDVFGHDPGFPSLLREFGVHAAAFARGPFRPWGPMLDGGFSTAHPPHGVQFPSEFEWIGPDGAGVLGLSLTGHYSSGYAIDECSDVESALAFVLELGELLGSVSATDHVVLPIGTDLGPPARWVTDVPRHAASRYVWPEIVCSTPGDVLAAVRADLAGSGRTLSPQTRDMNPIYTGKDVSFIDTKQAQWSIEHLLTDAETWAALASTLPGVPYPADALGEAWRLLAYGAHHDAITGTESDQVYVELSTGWRRAHDLSAGVLADALAAIDARIDARIDAGPVPSLRSATAVAVVVHNGLGRARDDVVTVALSLPTLGPLGANGLRMVDDEGNPVAYVAEAVRRDAGGRLTQALVRFRAQRVPPLGYRTYQLLQADETSVWEVAGEGVGSATISSDLHTLTADPERGGTIVSWVRREDGIELITPGRCGNELVVYPEYATHPLHGEGPWHLSPSGPGVGSAEAGAEVARLVSPIGQRLVVSGRIGRGEHDSTVTVWNGIDRVDVGIDTHSLDSSDELLRVRWPCRVPGSLPVVDTAEAVIGRGHGFPDVDAVEHPWTLDAPCRHWAASSTTARVRIRSSDGGWDRAIGVAEVIAGDSVGDHPGVRDFVVGLIRSGVTATTTRASGPRYGSLQLDSNAPDVRFAIGVHRDHRFVDEVVARAGDAAATEIERQMANRGTARVWVPARAPLREVWVPGLDVRGVDDLPVVVILADGPAGLAALIAEVVAELADHRITVGHPAVMPTWTASEQPADRSVAIVHRGTPGCVIDTEGTIHLSLQRASTAWPSGQWIDPPRRTTPDGTSFQLQHWSHHVDVALIAGAGDWRALDLVHRAHAVQRPMATTTFVIDPDDPRRTTGPHHLARQGTLLDIDADEVELRALRWVGDRLELRCSDLFGQGSQARIGHVDAMEPVDAVGGVGGAGRRSIVVRCAPFGSATVAIPAAVAAGCLVDRPPQPGSAWPVFSRHWVQGRGPGAVAGTPVAVHLRRGADVADPIGRSPRTRVTTWSVTVAVAWWYRAGPVDIDLRVEHSWADSGVHDVRRVRLDPGEFTTITVEIGAAIDETAFGTAAHHVVRATASCRWRADGVAEAGVVDDLAFWTVSRTDRPVELVSHPTAVMLEPGDVTDHQVLIVNHTTLDLHAEFDVVCPWGSWAHVARARQRILLPAGAVTPAPIGFSYPVGAPSGSWWWMVRVVVGPLTLYSSTARLIADGDVTVRSHDERGRHDLDPIV